MIIRRANNRDAKNLRAIRSSMSDAIIKERLLKQSVGEAEFLLLEADSRPVSFVVLKWGGKSTHPEYPDMEDLYTKEEDRGLGYGTMLVKECEERAGKRGFRKIGLAVNPKTNRRAKVFYERLGYRHDGKEFYLDGVNDGDEDWVIDLEKNLD